ncbi:MAG: molecular chaperone DnaK, partial [Ruminococcus sp.]|nr:molecular chaperone DnaK [Ruminococcus sp.]
LKSAIYANKTSELKSLKEELQKAFYDLSAKIYQQANPEGNADMGGIDPSQFAKGNNDDNNSGDDGFVDADFTEV